MNVPLSPIEAHERTIGEIFSDLYAFEVPAYQRPYAWEEKQARELLDDLLDAMDGKDASGGVYFLGSVVLIKAPSEPSARVVDGQQRLTTLTILLSILRDLTSDAERRLDRGRYVFQKANPDLGTQERCRLILREQDRSFFQKYVQNPGATENLPISSGLRDSQQRITENAQYIRGRLGALDESRRNSLMAFVLQHCYIVAVSVPTATSARRIFTVLNARGLDLAPTDILKADLLERAGPSREADLSKRWEAVESAVGREKMVELFGQIRMIYERGKPRQGLETGFPKFVEPFVSDPETFVSDVLEPVSDAAVLLTDTTLLEKQFGPAAMKAVRSLDRVDNKDWIPPVLLRLWKRQPTDGSDVAKFLLRLERLAYFLFVCRYGINERIARFAEVMNEVESGLSGTSTKPGVELTDIEQAQFLEALDGPLYTNGRVCKSVLQRLDEALSAGGATYDNIISIEHVLPQTVDEKSEWQMIFADLDDRTYWTHRIANLVFLTRRINTRASNWDFKRKKREYFASRDGTSPFPLTQGVLQAEKWSPGHLRERQWRLVEKLCEIWELTPNLDAGSPYANSPRAEELARRSGKELNKTWGVGAEHALYRKDGTWYHCLEQFPGALFDENGYIMFATEYDLQSCPGIIIRKQNNHLLVPAGIASLPGYKQVH